MCDFFSTNYGVTRNSLLNSLDFYHVCSSGLPPDIMHDIPEGYLPYTVKLMLNNFIANAYLSLEQLNQMIENFDYGYSDSCNKPSPISHTTLTSHETSGLAQSGKVHLDLWDSRLWFQLEPTEQLAYNRLSRWHLRMVLIPLLLWWSCVIFLGHDRLIHWCLYLTSGENSTLHRI